MLAGMGGLGSTSSTLLAHSTQPCVQRREEWSQNDQNGQNGHRTTLQRGTGVLTHPQPLYNTEHRV